ncbi:MAG TPA: AAA family ATPase [Ktedonobacteraceae bacterium]|nr:AAA family ATPase [Ktedonobacteraceae bacterium]
MQPLNTNTEEFGTLLSDIESEQLHWLWEKRIPSGKLTILDGDPGLGKSLLTLDLAARITTGKPMPDGTPGVKGRVLLIAPEDGAADTIKPRVEAVGGDPSRIRLLSIVKSTSHRTRETILSPFTLSKHFSTLVKTIYQTLPTLVILDPLMAVLGSGISASSDQKIRENLSLLAILAQRANCAILIVRHLNKGGSENPLYRGSGSIGIIATVRTGLLVVQHPFDENKRLLVPIKNNLSEKASNLTYQVTANADGIPSIQWLGTNHYPVASLLRGCIPLSLERQDILKVLQATSRPLGPKELAEQTGQDRTLIRQLLRRMLNAGDIISPAYGLYTTQHHLSPETSFPQSTVATPTTLATLATLATPLVND